ncbi:hypothetical protein X474_27925 [Dethiosulfatarculus sandiegensis]|uniref:Uncharacterized protein n=1 Tax=Dethiosulfatarculus sandiegensis TaxID=1429043 RepID=A0A0D2HJG0_9BACT|nr:hypothetical protein X474_27925 [Dethiosulfatarculus sandiegensis]
MGYPLVPLMSFYAATMLYASSFQQYALENTVGGHCLFKNFPLARSFSQLKS